MTVKNEEKSLAPFVANEVPSAALLNEEEDVGAVALLEGVKGVQILESRVIGSQNHTVIWVFLKSDRVARMVHSGGCSANDFRDVFKKNIEKRVRSLPEIDGLSKETVLSSWLAKYDAIYRGEEDFCKQPNRMALSAVSELILSKEQLYEMFQQILGIKKLEHQLIYNACQLDNGDEQAAQIRRELDGRLQLAEQMAR
ncbi:PREDICTED: calcium-dependent secretion activator 2-like, partial [Nestor notabilis]|uniref:calcium-dependent secretion activator 2-like n=1 Tax=Nestor notabilis TaxID=176057 RepID=UPI000523B591